MDNHVFGFLGLACVPYIHGTNTLKKLTCWRKGLHSVSPLYPSPLNVSCFKLHDFGGFRRGNVLLENLALRGVLSVSPRKSLTWRRGREIFRPEGGRKEGEMSGKMKTAVVFLAAAAVFHLFWGAYKVFHPVSNIRELGWTNPAAPGAIMIILGLFYCAVLFIVVSVGRGRERGQRG